MKSINLKPVGMLLMIVNQRKVAEVEIVGVLHKKVMTRTIHLMIAMKTVIALAICQKKK